MLKKSIIVSIIAIILITSIYIGFLISKQIVVANSNTNEVSTNIINKNSIESENIQEQIVFTNYLYDRNNPIQYIIEEQQKIKEIKNYINSIEWIETEEKTEMILWKIEIKGKESKVLLMNGEYNKTGIVTIQNNGISTTYKISSTHYAELLGFANKKFYLHKSSLEKPTKDICKTAQQKALSNLNEEEIKKVQKLLRETHIMMEYMLIDAVRLIKEPNSPYWKQFNIDEVFEDPYSGALIKTRGFFDTITSLKTIENIIKEAQIKEEIRKIYSDLQEAMNKHDLEGCFKVHEKIHDYDYWLINYPVYFDTFPPADWGGTDIYFGTLQ